MPRPGNLNIHVYQVMYVGSFPVAASDPPTRADYVRAQLEQIRENTQRKPVLLVISLAGIKICSVDGKSVFMAHALRRISYATCDSANCQFSFLAREPKGHFSLQYCHSFITESSDQAEELNSIVGNAFRMAYLAQLQKEQQQEQRQENESHRDNDDLIRDDDVVQPYAVTYSPHHHQHHHHHNRHHHHNNHQYQRLNPPPSSKNTSLPLLPPPSPSNSSPPPPPPAVTTTTSTTKSSSSTCCDNSRFSPFARHRRLSSSPSSLDRKKKKNQRRSNNISSAHSSPARNLNIIRADWLKKGGTADKVKHKDGGGVPTALCTDMNVLSAGGGGGGRDSPFRLRLDEANGNLTTTPVNSPKLVSLLEKPRSLPGLQSHHHSLRGRSQSSDELLTPSSVSSDDTNSPTELNSYKRLVDKPPLIKRLMLTEKTPEEELQPLVRDNNDDGLRTPASSGGYVNEGLVSQSSESLAAESQGEDPMPFDRSTRPRNFEDVKIEANALSPPSSEGGYMDQSSDGSKRSSEGHGSPLHLRESPFIREDDCQKSRDAKMKRISRTSGSGASSCSGSSNVGTPPPLPERYDSLQTSNYYEERELHKAPWFQAGIPREIALEILSQEPIGAFMVRESTSKPGCYALSLRVPREFQPTGIAHYLVMRTNKGYKIKGFTKEFCTLTALITHHSVMPELLPCPLSLSRYNPNFSKHDSSQDFADMDDDPDYNTLSDFRKMMADLSV